MDCFDALKIQPSATPKTIKLAYGKSLQNLLEHNTTHFPVLRTHYINALKLTRLNCTKPPKQPEITLVKAKLQITPATVIIARQEYQIDIDALYLSKNYDDALSFLLTLNTDEPQQIKTLSLIGQTYNKLKSWDLALEHLRQALRLSPHNLFILTEIAKSYTGKHELQLSIDILESVLLFSPANIEAYQLLTKVKHSWCQLHIDQINTLPSEEIECLILGLMNRNKYDKALNLLKTLQSRRTNRLHQPISYRLSAECMAALQQDSAIAYFEKSLELTYALNENPTDSLLTYIEHLFEHNHFDALLLLIDDLITFDPNQHRYHYIKGESLRLKGDYTQAITSLRFALGLAPSISYYYDSISHAYTELENHEKACEYTAAGLKLKPSNTDSWVQLGESYRLRGMFNKALECYTKGKSGHNYHLCLGLCLQSMGKFQESRDILYLGIKDDDSNFNEHMYHMGYAFELEGLFDKANSAYIKAGAELGDFIYFRMANCHFQSGIYNQARAFIKIYLEMHPDDQEALELADHIRTAALEGALSYE